jgi:hypothetical protein
MDYLELELEAALKYPESWRSYSYATVSEALHVPERTVRVMAGLHCVEKIDDPPQYAATLFQHRMPPLDKAA